MIADQLTSIMSLVPDEDKPRVGQTLVEIAGHQMELDRLNAEMFRTISDNHAADVEELTNEIDDIRCGIELSQIETALAKKCHARNIDPSVADRLINRCRFQCGRLLIVDNHGKPLTFEQAVFGLRGEYE